MTNRLKQYVNSITESHSVQNITKLFSVSLRHNNGTSQGPRSKIGPPFKDLYKLISDENILILAYSSIATETIDTISIERIRELSAELKNKSYKFSHYMPTKIQRIQNQKGARVGEKHANWKRRGSRSFENRMRFSGIPLGGQRPREEKKSSRNLSEWKDKIVQEAIRLILNAIYEPIFYQEGNNFGLRPRLGYQHAIEYIKNNCQNLPHVIEGDIKMAYDNVNFKVLLEILRKKITDPFFISLIKNFLHCQLTSRAQISSRPAETYSFRGTDEGPLKKHLQNTVGPRKPTLSAGREQHDILFLLLFNIYMHEFDKFVLNELSELHEFKGVPNVFFMPFRPISGKEKSKIPQKKHAFSEGSRISLTLRRRVKEIQDFSFRRLPSKSLAIFDGRRGSFFPESPQIPKESEGTAVLPIPKESERRAKEKSKIPQKKHAFSEGSRISLTLRRRVKEIQDFSFHRLPSKIASDFRRQTRVLFLKEKGRIFSDSFRSRGKYRKKGEWKEKSSPSGEDFSFPSKSDGKAKNLRDRSPRGFSFSDPVQTPTTSMVDGGPACNLRETNVRYLNRGNGFPDKFIKYVRYADDWILFSNLHFNSMRTLKEKCKTFLLTTLKLELCEDTTKITNIEKCEAKFLGFSISIFSRAPIKDRSSYKNNTSLCLSPHSLLSPRFPENRVRFSGDPGDRREKVLAVPLIKIGLDRERIMNKLIIKKMINSKERAIAS